MPRSKKYPDELRARGVRLALESNRPISQVAKDLGIQRESLRRWVRRAEADEGKRADLLTKRRARAPEDARARGQGVRSTKARETAERDVEEASSPSSEPTGSFARS